MQDAVFVSIGIMIIVATLGGYVARLLKQPLIPAYILMGVIMGPYGMGIIADIEIVKTLAEIGIAFLLFVVGLELDLKKLKHVGALATFGGTAQVTILFGIGFLIGKLTNAITDMQALYLGFILAFSSTMVVVKLLSDKRSLDTLHGRIIIGLLLIEDFFAIFAISVLSTLDHINIVFFVAALVKALVILVLAFFLSKYIIPGIFKTGAKSQEMLFLLALSICFFFSLLATYLGFSIIIGAFIGGVVLGNLPYNIEIIGKVKPLRDFFATLFFVSLGMELAIGSIHTILVPLAILISVIIIFKPLLIMFISNMFGYSKRTSFLSAISLAQTSEFSLIIATQGMALGHINQDIFTLAVLLATGTIIVTSYLTNYDHQMYFSLAKYLKVFDRIGNNKKELEFDHKDNNYKVILIGYDRLGYNILRTLKKKRKKVLVIDYNPDRISRLRRDKIACLYGDVSDPEVLERINLKSAEIIISTAPNLRDNLYMIQKIKKANKKAMMFVTTQDVDDALILYDQGADYVILPHFLGGHHVSLMLEEITGNFEKLLSNKSDHLQELAHHKKNEHLWRR